MENRDVSSKALPQETLTGHRRLKVFAVGVAACLLVRRECFEAVGGFDEGYVNGYEDVDLCFAFQARGWYCVFEPASVLIHHGAQAGPTRFAKARDNIARLHEKWLGRIQPDVVILPDGTAERPGSRQGARVPSR